MALPPRPTTRCVTEDLNDGWDHPRDRDVVRLPEQRQPLHTLRHPVIRHAVETFKDVDGGDHSRERIECVRETRFWKLKTAGWRGAIYVDDGGQPWIVAAGRRRDGDNADFYEVLKREVERNGVNGYLPTDEDRKRLKRELGEVALSAWEQKIHDDAVDAFEVAHHAGVGTFRIDAIGDPGSLAGAEVSIERVEIMESEDSLAEVIVTVKPSDWSTPGLLQRAEVVVMAAIQPDEQRWDPDDLGSEHLFTFVAEDSLVDELVAASRSPERVPGGTTPGTVAHYAHKTRLTEHYVEGTATQALCGDYFVPRQLPDDLEICPRCEALMRVLPAGR